MSRKTKSEIRILQISDTIRLKEADKYNIIVEEWYVPTKVFPKTGKLATPKWKTLGFYGDVPTALEMLPEKALKLAPARELLEEIANLRKVIENVKLQWSLQCP